MQKATHYCHDTGK